MKTLTKWLVRAVWIAVIAGAGWWAWRWYGARSEEATAVRYRTAPVVRADVFRTVEATGTVQPIKKVVRWRASLWVRVVRAAWQSGQLA